MRAASQVPTQEPKGPISFGSNTRYIWLPLEVASHCDTNIGCSLHFRQYTSNHRVEVYWWVLLGGDVHDVALGGVKTWRGHLRIAELEK